jgi:competence protein ComFB
MSEEKTEYILVNIAEELVKLKVREMMAEYDMCRCKKCFLDVCAIVLNTMDPHYVTTEKGSLFSLLEATHYQFKTDLTVCVLQAMKRVKSRPMH